jgi:hypothetical protein
MANISLKQTRVDNTYSFTGDHTTIEVDIGDYVKITDPTKYLEDAFARVMRVVEREEQDGTLVFDFICLQYSDAPYQENIYLNAVDEPFGASYGLRENIGTWTGSIFNNADFFTTYEVPFGNTWFGSYEIGGVWLVNETDTGNGNVYYANATVQIADEDAAAMSSGTTAGSELDINKPWLALKGNIGALEFGSIVDGWETQNIILTNINPQNTLAPETVSVEFDLNTNEFTNFGWFPLTKIGPGYYTIGLQYVNPDQYPERKSIIATTPAYYIGDLDLDTPNLITLDDIYYGRGTRLWDEFSLSKGSTNVTTPTRIYPRYYDACNIAQVDFEVSTNIFVNWSTLDSDLSKIQISPTANITFEHTTTTANRTFTLPLSGIDLIDNSAGGNIDAANIKASWVNNISTVSTIPSDYGLDAEEWYPARLQTDLIAQHRNFTDLTIDGGILFTHIPHNYRYLG